MDAPYPRAPGRGRGCLPAVATFNPHYADLERRIGRFLDAVDPRREDRVVSQ